MTSCATLIATQSSSDGLPRGAPSEQGVDARAVLRFLDELAAVGMELHSFMLYRHGHVVAEGWWRPYRADLRHQMYSLTKSVTACAVGLAIAERRFALDDKVVSFFAKELPANRDERLAAMRVRDLLTMQTGHAQGVSGAVWRQIDTGWVAEFFKIPLAAPPGEKFVYNTAASFMLSAIITRTTGQTLRDYLQPRLFQPLGIERLDWEADPEGITSGGGGLTWSTADALKLGVLHLRKGEWQGQRVLPAEWVESATRPQAQNGRYGFQWWIGPGNAYYAAGSFGQFSIVFPRHDAVLAATAALPETMQLLPYVWRYFPAAFGDAQSRASADATLHQRCAELTLLAPLVARRAAFERRVSGRKLLVHPNEDGVISLRFDFSAERCIFFLEDARGTHQIAVGLSGWLAGVTTMTGQKLHHGYQPSSMRVVAGGRWFDDQTFEMTWQFVETAFRDRVLCRFDDEGLTLDRSVNVNLEATSRPTLRATLPQA